MTRTQKGRRRAALFWVLSLLVAVSMVCGTVLVVWPSPQRRPQATPTMTSISPTPTPAMVTPSPSPATPTNTPMPVIVPTPFAQPTS
ncbi:MAG: hypothetical protein H5T68_00275 [Chloroflexi bacterium]|nr:hypothetical protein [Chloroflexota bacterium]